MSEKRMIVTSWQKKELEAQRGEAMAAAAGEAGQSLDVGQVCLRASSHLGAPEQSRGRAAPSQVCSAQDVNSWDVSTDPWRKVYI